MMKITIPQMDAVLAVCELARDTVITMVFEVSNNVTGTMYSQSDIEDAQANIAIVDKLIDDFYN